MKQSKTHASREVRPAKHPKAKPTAARGVTSVKDRPAPEPSETAATAHARERLAKRRFRTSVSAQVVGDVFQIDSPHSDHSGFQARLLDMFGTRSREFVDQGLGRLGAIMRRKGASMPTERELNAALAAVDGLEPENEMEAMLAIQMAATHEMAMEMLTRAKQTDLLPTLQECGSLAVKLLRTYAAQVDAFARLRRGGEQRVIVQHVNVSEGGQAAIVGAINKTGGG